MAEEYREIGSKTIWNPCLLCVSGANVTFIVKVIEPGMVIVEAGEGEKVIFYGPK